MKFVLIDVNENDIFTEEFATKEEAIKTAGMEWERLTKREQNKRKAFYVLESINEDEEAIDHLDGNLIINYK